MCVWLSRCFSWPLDFHTFWYVNAQVQKLCIRNWMPRLTWQCMYCSQAAFSVVRLSSTLLQWAAAKWQGSSTRVAVLRLVAAAQSPAMQSASPFHNQAKYVNLWFLYKQNASCVIKWFSFHCYTRIIQTNSFLVTRNDAACVAYPANSLSPSCPPRCPISHHLIRNTWRQRSYKEYRKTYRCQRLRDLKVIAIIKHLIEWNE